MKRSPDSPPPPPPPPPPEGDKPADPEVYDLGSTSGEESDEEERERALRELVEAESRGESSDADIPVIEITSDEPSDEVEREQALLDVLKLGAVRPSDAEDDVPVVEISTTEEVDDAEREQALRELLELEAKRKRLPDDVEPVVEITIDEEPDDAVRQSAIHEVVKLGPERSRSSTPHRPRIPAAAPLPEGEGSDEVVKARAVLEVVQHAVRYTKALALAKPMESYRGRPIVLTILAVACLSVGLYSLIARPDWVYGPDPARVPIAEREANLRFTTYLIAQRVKAYRDARRGFLPGSLAEVGEEWPGITYSQVSSSEFELRALEPGVPPIIYRSIQDLKATLLDPSRPFLRPRQ